MAEELNMPETLVQVSPTVRIERGPELKKGIATEELLSDDVTHPGYHAPKPALDADGNPMLHPKTGEPLYHFARDAKGSHIELGKEMYYLDFKGAHGWYLYQLHDEERVLSQAERQAIEAKPEKDRTADEKAALIDGKVPHQRYHELAFYPTKEAALEAAQKLG